MKSKLLQSFAVIMVVSALNVYCAAHTEPISSPQGIAVLDEIELGGVKQWILVRGEDVENPILLFLHGGPGSPEMATHHAFMTGLESHFVVVHWDQRGAGKSYHVSIPESSMTIERFIEDAHLLTGHLKERFGRHKIYIMGHSWGSVLGTLTVDRYPEDYYAYIGIGQVVDLVRNEKISYEYVIKEAEERDKPLAKMHLKMIGGPPYDNVIELAIQRQYLQKFGGGPARSQETYNKIYRAGAKAPEYTLLGHIKMARGTIYSTRQMWPELMTVDLLDTVPRIDVPVYFLHGRHDYNTPWELCQEYYNKLEAPEGKTLIWFEESAHSPNLEEPRKFERVLEDKVLPETYPGG